MKTGIILITEERKEQIMKHGFNYLHDKQHQNGELEMAALYLLTGADECWPDGWDIKYKEKFDSKIGLSKEKTIERLKVVGALCAAQIDILLNS